MKVESGQLESNTEQTSEDDISQSTSNKGKNILIVVPSTLKEQWAEELANKFYLPTQVLGDGDKVIEFGKNVCICSYNFCYNHQKELRAINWDLVVIDEAHKLRNLYTESNKIDQSVASVFKDTFKILLTATPMQNSLLDLYSLASIVDSNLFLNLESFKDSYINKDNSKELAERLQTIVTRTLRKQVLEYIRYTDRYSITQEFELSLQEKQLYELVLKFCDEREVSKDGKLGKPKVNALQRMTFLKELASSPKAFLQTASKLQDSREICETAQSITVSSKLLALDNALRLGFENLAKIGAEQKAVIFTESLATQEYIADYLSNLKDENGLLRFARNDIVILNGSAKNREQVIHSFKHKAKILISTEVGGEGLNLQFCSLVINYDMPWNPQKIEQRIGRCHRYGQKHDVCVVNFLNSSNYADARLYELLNQKLKLFEGVFGASDTVLGVLENTDFEQRIRDIYKDARTHDEIDKFFANLQSELEVEIKRTKENAKSKVFEYLNQDVANRFKGIGKELNLLMGRKEILLWELSKYIAGNQAYFNDDRHTVMFDKGRLFGKRLSNMHWSMDKSADKSSRYRIGCQPAQRILSKADNSEITSASAEYTLNSNASSELQKLKYKGGYIALYRIQEKGDWWYNDFMLVGQLLDGTQLDREPCEEILFLQSDKINLSWTDREDDGRLIKHCEALQDNEMNILEPLFERELAKYTKDKQDSIVRYFDQYAKSMYGWADDKITQANKVLKIHEQKLNLVKLSAKNEKNFNKKVELINQSRQAEKDFADRQIENLKYADSIRHECQTMIENNRKKMQLTHIGKQDFILKFELR
ncbi:MAG: DEAD/DEAH box helicase [Clostridiales bacterium]|nr:DEAD/DEAH box helicase [Clostridiales bacterium]